jgi:hypothetical protein
MEIKPVYAVIALAIVFVALLAADRLAAPGPAAPDYAAQASGLYMQGASFGENATAYTYAYTEYSNGFAENYTLSSDGKSASVEVLSALSDKKLYFLPNDTILCVRFSGTEGCSSVKNESAAKSYVARMRGRLLNGTEMEAMKADAEYMMNRSIIRFSPFVRAGALAGGAECSEIEYTIDYRNMTLQDMTRFGVTSATPQVFQFRSCVGNDGAIERLYYNYTYQGKLYIIQQELIGADLRAAPAIAAPQNLSGNALDLAFSENTYRQELFNKCYLGQADGEGRGACIQKIALDINDRDLCETAGTVRDRCLVAFMPYLKDPGICAGISAPEFADDCYIELAGAYKNGTWCDRVKDGTKKSYCLQVALPPAPSEPENQSDGTVPEGGLVAQNVSVNESAVPPDVVDIFNGLERTNSTNSTQPGQANSTPGENGTG